MCRPRLFALVLALALLVPAPPAPGQDPIDPIDPIDKDAWTPRAAAHLLRRAGFGGTLEEVEALHGLGLEGAIASLVAGPDAIGEHDLPPFEALVTGRPARADLAGLTPEERNQRIRDHRRADARQLGALRGWWIDRMIRTRHPLVEKMTLFWHGHFTSGMRDVKNSYHLHVQNELLRRHAIGNFGTLLAAVARDPAMLEYLDNNTNRKAHPNENFARELLELFTLGEGHYTEDDIQAAARAFTGWTFRGNEFVQVDRQHDDGVKTFLGHTGPLDGQDVLDILLAEERTSVFVAGRIFRFLAGVEPSPDVAEGLGAILRQHQHDLAPMLRVLLASRAFHDPAVVGTRIEGPIELLVGLVRELEIDAPLGPPLARASAALGQDLFEPPNVKGWDGGTDWITSGLLLGRYNVCLALVGDAADRRALSDRARAGRRAPPLHDPLATIERRGLATADEIVDFYLRLLLAAPPPPDLIEALRTTLGPDFAPDDPDAATRLRTMLRLLVSTPEFQLH